MTLHRKILSALAIATATLSICTARSNKTDWDAAAKLRKAEYVFMRACGANCQDSLDVGYRLLVRASALNPNDMGIAAEEGFVGLASYGNDSVTNKKLHEKMYKYFMANPSDVRFGRILAQMAKSGYDFDTELRIWQMLDSVYPDDSDMAVNLSNAYLKLYWKESHGKNADNAQVYYDKSIGILDSLERSLGKDIGLTSQKVRAYAIYYDSIAVKDAIKRELGDLLEAKPNNSSAHLYAGQMYGWAGLDTLSLASLKRSCELDSTNGEAFTELAKYYFNHKDSVAYDRTVFKALESSNLEFSVKEQIFNDYILELYQDTTQWDRIEKLFGVLQEENSSEPRLYTLYGAFEDARGNSQAALEQFSYAMALDPTNSKIRMYVIQLANVNDSIDYSLSVAKEGMKLFPSNFYYPIVAAANYNSRKQYGEAVKLLESVDVSNVENPSAVSNLLCTLADNYYMVDSVDLAFETYEKSIKYDPNNFLAYNNAGYFMAEKGVDLERSVRYTRYAVLSEPQNSTYLDSYAWALFKSKDYEKARENIDLALRYSGFAVDTVHIATDTVYVEADSAYDVVPVDTVAYAEVDYDDIASDPDSSALSADIYAHAGDIYFMCGEPEKALEFWEKAAALKPDDELLARKVKNKTYFYK